MSKQNQPVAAQDTHKPQQKPTPAPITEISNGVDMDAQDMGGLGFANGLSLRRQTEQLGNPRLQVIQRQIIARRIGQQQGNYHLRQLVAFSQQQAPYQPSIVHRHASSAVLHRRCAVCGSFNCSCSNNANEDGFVQTKPLLKVTQNRDSVNALTHQNHNSLDPSSDLDDAKSITNESTYAAGHDFTKSEDTLVQSNNNADEANPLGQTELETNPIPTQEQKPSIDPEDLLKVTQPVVEERNSVETDNAGSEEPSSQQERMSKDAGSPALAHQNIHKEDIKVGKGLVDGSLTTKPPAEVQALAKQTDAHSFEQAGTEANAKQVEPNGQHTPDAGATAANDESGVSTPHLEMWKASVARSVSAIQAPQLDGAMSTPSKFAEQAQSVAQQRQAEHPDYLQDARGQMPLMPQEPPRENTLDTEPADAAVTSVESVSSAKLPDQTFPTMQPLPSYSGTSAGGSGVEPAPIIPPATLANDTPSAPESGPDLPADAKADKVKDKIADAKPTTASAGSGEAITLQDKGAASLDPLPTAQSTEIGDVVARLLQDAGTYAKEIVDAALTQLDPSQKVEALTELAKPLVAKQQGELTTELKGIADVAGVSAEQLDAKVASQKADVTAKNEKVASELDAKSTQAKSDIQTREKEETTAISSASNTVITEAERKQQAAKGDPDAPVIDAKRDSYIEKVNSIVATGLARYRSSLEKRSEDLDHAGSEQKTAYLRLSQAEAKRIKALTPDDPIKGKIESRPVLDWSDQQSLEVDGTVARLKREATNESTQMQGALNVVAATARDQIRNWAAEKKGTHRNWWDRLLDIFNDWGTQVKASNEVWETQRNAETRDKIVSDFDMLERLHSVMATGNQEAFQAEIMRLSKKQRVVAIAYIRSGGKDSIGAVAISLIESIKMRRVPELTKTLEEAAIATLGWEALNQLGAAQNPGFDAGLIIRDVRRAVKDLFGTDEDLLFKALQGRTPIQVAAIRQAYKKIYERDMDVDISEELSGSEKERAEAYLSGDKTAGAIATLRDAMDGTGTDEDLIMQTLRGKTQAERDAITAAYKEKYGVDLRTDLEDDMSGNDLDQADALLAGDTTKADAIAINEAMDGLTTDEEGINAVYSRIRDEVETDAKHKGMTTAEVDAEIKRRTSALKAAYGDKYGVGDPSKLEADYHDDLSGGELNLVLAEQENDQTAIDTAKIQIEHESLYTDDDKVNAVLSAQHARAEKEIMHDLEVEFNEKSGHMTRDERKKAREQMKEQAKGMIERRAKENMTALKEKYDAENPEFGFQAVIDLELQGYSHDEAIERLASGGKLDDAHELKYAIFGAGSNEERIKEILKGKSKKEIDQLKDEYKALTKNDLMADLEGDVEGRDLADSKAMLNGTSTPEEKMAYLRKRKEWEVNEGTGILGELAENEEEEILERTVTHTQTAYDNYQHLKQKFGENHPRTQAALEDFERWSGYGDKDIEEHRAAVDSITDKAATGAAIVAGIAVSVLTAGTATPAMAALATALAATATSMATKQLIKGGAYDIEAVAVDIAQGTAEALLAVATAGTGEAALQALLKSPAFSTLAKAARSGTFSKLMTKGLESGIEGAIQGLPSGMVGAMLDENTWKNNNPFGVIMKAGGQASLMGGGMGVAMGAGMEALPKGKSGKASAEGERIHSGPLDESIGISSDRGIPSSDSSKPTANEAGLVPTDTPMSANDTAHSSSVDEGFHRTGVDKSANASSKPAVEGSSLGTLEKTTTPTGSAEEMTAPTNSPEETITPNGRSTEPDAPDANVKGDAPEVKTDSPEAKVETPEVKDLGTEGGKKVLAEEPTVDGKHKVKVTEDSVLICSSCELIRGKYAEELQLADTDPEVAGIRDALNKADTITDPMAKTKVETQIQQSLEGLRSRKLSGLQERLGLSSEALRILQEQQVRSSLVEKLVDAGIKADDVALFSEVPHGLEILEGLTDKRIAPHVAERVLSLTDANGLLDQVNVLVNKGSLKNLTKLRAVLEAINKGDQGLLNELNIASELAKNGHELELGTQGDIVDLGMRGEPNPAKEVMQVKEVRSGKEVRPGQEDAFTKNLQDAENQLAGKSTSGKPKTDEIPQPGFIRVADISIINPDNPLFNADRAALSRAINDGLRHSTIPDGSPVVERIRIRNNRGVEVFEAPDFKP